ncbi:site-2 protease family protein [Adlercreutzia faecimuris]|uniref:Site-2 protease family protein n=1 Tax=Adlercreutzia faecimuris TaxID=2897341 RepID=A0ABS9WII1_9ACTN|nr:site-2 protease family protein [Adlercreutzia sp. JBNU-10]MCI2242688.1 site-2 protease family protein [Adlercreutzia sp. JBNU-10]
MSSNIELIYITCSILSFVPALVLHEVAHGFAAWKLGDPTAKRSGRLSLNPLKHIDPFGTVILPLMLMLMNMPVFGYAKPVPYNPRYFKDPRRGDVIVGLAGPAANLAMACVAAAVAWLLLDPARGGLLSNDLFSYFYLWFLPQFALVNLFLMFFNLLPIPPLDGSSIFALLIPARYLPKYYRIQQYAFPVFMVAVVLLPYLIHVNPFSWYLGATAGNLGNLLFPFRIY